MAFAAEKSRVEGDVISMPDYRATVERMKAERIA
jgi:hypothetical protein